MQRVHQILFVALIILTLLMLSAFIVVPILEGKVKSELTQMLKKRLPNADIAIKDMDIHLITGDFVLNRFQLRDTSKHVEMADIRGVFINNVSWYKLLKNRKLHTQHIRVDNISLVLSKYNDSLDIAEFWSENIEENISLHEITVKTFDFKLRDKKEKKTAAIYNGNVNLTFKDMSPDIIAGHIIADSLYYKNNAENYEYKTGKINVNIGGNRLKIADFKVLPRYPIMRFSERQGKKVTRHKLHIPEIELVDLDVRRLISEREVIANKIKLEGADYMAFDNPNMPIDSSEYKYIPQEYLRQLNYKVNIDTLQLRAADIYYATINSETEKPGHVSFNRTYCTLYNVSNDSANLLQNPYMTMDFVSDFMGEGELTGSFRFHLMDENNSYQVVAELGEMDIAEVNTLTIPSINLKITGGHNLSLYMNIAVDEGDYSGIMEFSYEDLQIELRDSDEESEKKVVNWLFNNLLVKKENIKEEKNFRTGVISYERVTYYGFFKNMWHAIEGGITTSIMRKRTADQLRKMVKNNDDFTEDMESEQVDSLHLN